MEAGWWLSLLAVFSASFYAPRAAIAAFCWQQWRGADSNNGGALTRMAGPAACDEGQCSLPVRSYPLPTPCPVLA
eukprot:3175533-Rhodomonas_salina.1